MKDKYIIAKYLRLSSDDGTCEESNSIKNQRELIDNHIQSVFIGRDYDTIELIDDGFTGTNMNRNGVKKLLILAETGEIDCIIVKDFSRFARDYVEVGKYMEEKFPLWQVRFISVNDSYDSSDYRGITSGMDTALKNIVYAMYSKDLSEKVKSARKARYKKGIFQSPYAFYGYKKDPDNKAHIIIDEKAASIVRRIFEMKLSGMSASDIAIKFNDEGILTPARYKKSIDPLCRNWNTVSDFHLWSSSLVGNILRNERYTGKMISGKLERIAVGSNKYKSVPKEKQIVVLDTHEPIISQKMFDDVREATKQSRKPKTSKFSLSRLLRCGHCHHTLDRYGKKTVSYRCGYSKYIKDNKCITTAIKEADICNILSEVIFKEISAISDSGQAEISLNKSFNAVSKIKAIQKLIANLREKRVCEYTKYAKGEQSEKEFETVRDNINSEINAYNEQIEQMKYQDVTEDSNTFKNLFRKYADIKDLNTDIVRELVKEIYIYRDNRIKIVWNIDDCVNEIQAKLPN